MTRKRKARKARRKVERSERVKPPPEAAQHLRAWPLQLLLVEGPPLGLDADEFEAALQIVETFRVLTSELAVRGTADGLERGALGIELGKSVMSDRDAERCAVWFTWAARLPSGAGPILAAQIEDLEPISSVAGLRFACRLWARTRADLARSHRVDTAGPIMLTSQVRRGSPDEIDASPVNLPVRPHRPILSTPPPASLPIPLSGQMRQSVCPSNRLGTDRQDKPLSSAHGLRRSRNASG